jgi:hypothetical protein
MTYAKIITLQMPHLNVVSINTGVEKISDIGVIKKKKPKNFERLFFEITLLCRNTSRNGVHSDGNK